MTNHNIEKYAKLFPNELRYVIDDMPKDDIDWALIIYLLAHSSKNNIITLGKISSYFQLDKDEVEKRLRRMIWLVNIYSNYGYAKHFTTYQISEFAADVLMKMMETLEIKPKKPKRCPTFEEIPAIYEEQHRAVKSMLS